MKEARKTPVTIIVAVTVILLISYLIIDYFNIPTALGMDISRINVDLLGNVINAVIAIFVFVSGYCLIDRWNVKRVNNQKAIAESILHSIYKNCLLYVECLDQPQIVKALIEQTDFNKRYNILDDPSPDMRYAQIPFTSESSLLSYFQNGILDKESFDTYQSIKQAFTNYVFVRVTFFDAPEKYGTMRSKAVQLLKEQLHSYGK
jgi:hypothetical protein